MASPARTLIAFLRKLSKPSRTHVFAVLMDGDDCDLCKPENLHYWIEAFGETDGPAMRAEFCAELGCPIGG